MKRTRDGKDKPLKLTPLQRKQRQRAESTRLSREAAARKKRTKKQSALERWYEHRSKFASDFLTASERIPMLRGEELAQWFLELPAVKEAQFYTAGGVDRFRIVTVDGEERSFSSGVRPEMLLDAMRCLIDMLDWQLRSATYYKRRNKFIYFSQKKQPRKKAASRMKQLSASEREPGEDAKIEIVDLNTFALACTQNAHAIRESVREASETLKPEQHDRRCRVFKTKSFERGCDSSAVCVPAGTYEKVVAAVADEENTRFADSKRGVGGL